MEGFSQKKQSKINVVKLSLHCHCCWVQCIVSFLSHVKHQKERSCMALLLHFFRSILLSTFMPTTAFMFDSVVQYYCKIIMLTVGQRSLSISLVSTPISNGCQLWSLLVPHWQQNRTWANGKGDPHEWQNLEKGFLFIIIIKRIDVNSFPVLAKMKSCFEDLRSKTFQWGKKGLWSKKRTCYRAFEDFQSLFP